MSVVEAVIGWRVADRMQFFAVHLHSLARGVPSRFVLPRGEEHELSGAAHALYRYGAQVACRGATGIAIGLEKDGAFIACVWAHFEIGDDVERTYIGRHGRWCCRRL